MGSKLIPSPARREPMRPGRSRTPSPGAAARAPGCWKRRCPIPGGLTSRRGRGQADLRRPRPSGLAARTAGTGAHSQEMPFSAGLLKLGLIEDTFLCLAVGKLSFKCLFDYKSEARWRLFRQLSQLQGCFEFTSHHLAFSGSLLSFLLQVLSFFFPFLSPLLSSQSLPVSLLSAFFFSFPSFCPHLRGISTLPFLCKVFFIN